MFRHGSRVTTYMAKASRWITRTVALIRQYPVDYSPWSLKCCSTATSSWSGKPWRTKRIGGLPFKILCPRSNFLSSVTCSANHSTKIFRWEYRSCRVDQSRLSLPRLARCFPATMISRVEEHLVAVEEEVVHRLVVAVEGLHRGDCRVHLLKEFSILQPMKMTCWEFQNTWTSMVCLNHSTAKTTRSTTQTSTRIFSTGRNMTATY